MLFRSVLTCAIFAGHDRRKSSVCARLRSGMRPAYPCDSAGVAIALHRGLPAVLRERNFRLLLTGQAISIIGDAISMIALPFAILAMGGSVGQVGLVLGARAVPNAIFLLVGGVWADRLPRRLVMLTSDLVRGATMVAIFAVLVSDHGSIWALVALSAIYGVGEAFFRPALSGVIPQCVSSDRLQEAYGLLATTPALGKIGRAHV